MQTTTKINLVTTKGTFTWTVAEASAWLEEYQPVHARVGDDGDDLEDVARDVRIGCSNEGGWTDGPELRAVLEAALGTCDDCGRDGPTVQSLRGAHLCAACAEVDDAPYNCGLCNAAVNGPTGPITIGGWYGGVEFIWRDGQLVQGRVRCASCGRGDEDDSE